MMKTKRNTQDDEDDTAAPITAGAKAHEEIILIGESLLPLKDEQDVSGATVDAPDDDDDVATATAGDADGVGTAADDDDAEKEGGGSEISSSGQAQRQHIYALL